MGLRFPKPQPSAVTKHRKRVDADAALAQAYADVDARDAGYCWVTGRYTVPNMVDPRMRREHHHLVPRSRSKELKADPNNIVTVCSEAHSLITQGWIVVEGTDARQPIFFHYAEFVKPSMRPFAIKARRSRSSDE